MKKSILAVLSVTPSALFAQGFNVVNSLDEQPPDEKRHHLLLWIVAAAVICLVLTVITLWRCRRGRSSTKALLLILALGGAGVADVAAAEVRSARGGANGTPRTSAIEAPSVPTQTSSQLPVSERMFQKVKEKLVHLTDTNGQLTAEMKLLLALRPTSTNWDDSDLCVVSRPINRYPFSYKYPYIGDKKNLFPFLSLYDANTIGQASQCLGNEFNWVQTAQALRESVRLCNRIDQLLKDSAYSLVALRPLNFFDKGGARIGLIFLLEKPAATRVAEYYIYFLDPEKVGSMPEAPSPNTYMAGPRDKKYLLDARVCDMRTAEYVRAFYRIVEAAVADVSAQVGSR